MSAEPRGINGSLWALAALGFAGGLGGGVVFPILPIVGQALGIAPAMIGLILSLNRITRLGVNPFTGHLVDRFGARWPLTCGLLIVGSPPCATRRAWRAAGRPPGSCSAGRSGASGPRC